MLTDQELEQRIRLALRREAEELHPELPDYAAQAQHSAPYFTRGRALLGAAAAAGTLVAGMALKGTVGRAGERITTDAPPTRPLGGRVLATAQPATGGVGAWRHPVGPPPTGPALAAVPPPWSGGSTFRFAVSAGQGGPRSGPQPAEHSWTAVVGTDGTASRCVPSSSWYPTGRALSPAGDVLAIWAPGVLRLIPANGQAPRDVPIPGSTGERVQIEADFDPTGRWIASVVTTLTDAANASHRQWVDLVDLSTGQIDRYPITWKVRDPAYLSMPTMSWSMSGRWLRVGYAIIDTADRVARELPVIPGCIDGWTTGDTLTTVVVGDDHQLLSTFDPASGRTTAPVRIPPLVWPLYGHPRYAYFEAQAGSPTVVDRINGKPVHALAGFWTQAWTRDHLVGTRPSAEGQSDIIALDLQSGTVTTMGRVPVPAGPRGYLVAALDLR